MTEDTIHVAVDGTVTRGMHVPHNGAARRVAAPPRRVKTERYRGESVPANEWVPDARAPSGYRRTNILGVHRATGCTRAGCTNHIRGT